MENQKGPNHTEDLEILNGPDGSAVDGQPFKKRPRISLAPILSSDQVSIEAEDAPEEDEEITEDDAEVTEEERELLGHPELDPDDGEDELLGDSQFLDDTDLDGDELNEESGRRAGSGRDLDVPDEELENAGSAMQQEDEENDYFDLEDGPDDDPSKDLF